MSPRSAGRREVDELGQGAASSDIECDVEPAGNEAADPLDHAFAVRDGLCARGDGDSCRDAWRTLVTRRGDAHAYGREPRTDRQNALTST